MPTSRSVAISVALSLVTSNLTFCRIGLGLRAGAIAAAVWNACNIFSRLQVIFIGAKSFRTRSGVPVDEFCFVAAQLAKRLACFELVSLYFCSSSYVAAFSVEIACRFDLKLFRRQQF